MYYCVGSIGGDSLGKNESIVLPKNSDFNTSGPKRNGRHFAADFLKWGFFYENCYILIHISLKHIRQGPIENNPALFQILALCRAGDKPLSELVMAYFADAYVRHSASMSKVLWSMQYATLHVINKYIL